MAEMPKEFAASYKANMERPLFDMKDRAAETADQMERVAKATRAAAFDAEKFGQALRDAQTDRFAGLGGFNPFGGPDETGETGMGQNPKNRTFPWQGAGPSGAPMPARENAAETSRGLGGAGLRSGAQTAGNTMRDLAARGDEDARTEMLRTEAEQRRHQERINRLVEEGKFRSAAEAMGRADRAAERREDRFRGLNNIREQGMGRNMGEAFSNFRREFGVDTGELIRSRLGDQFDPGQSLQENFKRMANEFQKPESVRAEEQKTATESRPSNAQASGGGLATESTLKLILNKIQERPILVA
jgi:hypothetical protein